MAGVTVTVLLLVHRTGSNWTMPLHRVLEVLLGIVVALAISTLVLPTRARLRLRHGLAQEYLLMSALFEAVLQGFRGKPSEHLAQLWKDSDAAVQALAKQWGSRSYEVSFSWLSKLESGEHEMTLPKLISLATGR
jgi:uncharacterized membrane protein YccC